MSVNPAMLLVIDTDVAIDYLRGQPDATAYFKSITGDRALMSMVTVAGLYAGVREGVERTMLEQFLLSFELVPANEAIAVQGGLFRRDYKRSHQMGLADALIAATAVSVGATLVTLNDKHFPMVADLLVPYRKP